jgi:hypothetical protein
MCICYRDNRWGWYPAVIGASLRERCGVSFGDRIRLASGVATGMYSIARFHIKLKVYSNRFANKDYEGRRLRSHQGR